MNGAGVRTIEAPTAFPGFCHSDRSMAKGTEIREVQVACFRSKTPGTRGRVAELSRIILRFMT